MTKERLRKALENILEAVRADYPAAVRLSEIDDIAEDALEESTPGPRAIACGQCGNLVNHCDRCKAELLAASWEYACKRMSAVEPSEYHKRLAERAQAKPVDLTDCGTPHFPEDEPKGNQARGMCQIANRPACDSYPRCQCGQTLSPVQQGNL